MNPLHRHQLRVCGLWRCLPWCCRALLLLVTCQLFFGASAVVAILLKGCSLSADSRQDAGCSSDQYQILASALVTQLCFGAVIIQGLLADCPASHLWAGAAFSCLSGLMWLLLVAVVGNTLHMGSRVAWGLAVILFAAADLWLLQLSHLQLGWRQHSKLPCDPKRKHSAEQQQLYQAENRFTCLASSCLHILILSMVNGLVLALSDGRAGISANGTAAADSAGQHQAAMETAKTGVLVAVGFTLLPALWLAASCCSVHSCSRTLELLATATLAIAELLPALQLYFVFSPAYAWDQSLWVRVLFLAAPMGMWMLLLIMTWCSFRDVMTMLRHPLAQEIKAQGHNGLLTGVDSVDIPDVLQPLMQGAWLLKSSIHTPQGPHMGISKDSSKQTLSMVAVPSSGTNSIVANNSAAAGVNSSGGLLAACGGCSWRSILQACSSRQHHRFFQLSMDGTTLRWSWNKYVLLYFVPSLGFEPDQLRITLRCVLDPDLQLTFPDLETYTQWAAGLRAAMQVLTGLPAQEALSTCIPAGVLIDHPAAEKQHGNLLGAATTANGVSAAVQPVTGLQQDVKFGMQLSPTSPVAGSQISGLSVQGASALQHQLVRAALYGQHGPLPLLSATTSSCGATLAAGLAPAGSCRMLPAFLLPSRRKCQADPNALALQQAQAMAQHIQAAGSSCNLTPAGKAPADCSLAVELTAARPRASAVLQDVSAADTEAEQVGATVHHLDPLQQQEQQPRVLQEAMQLTAYTQAACSPAVPAAPTTTVTNTMFGAFRIPAGLQADVPLQETSCQAQLSSSSGSGSVHNAAGGSKGATTASSLGTTRSADSGARWASSQQVAQGPSVLNAGYCLSPLASAHSRDAQHHHPSQQQRHTGDLLTHALLPPTKQRQLLLWLQQQSSGSCPESDGPQMSPCYSLDSGHLQQPLSAGGTAAGSTAHQQQLLLQLMQQPSTGTPNSAAGGIAAQQSSASGISEGLQAQQQRPPAHWALRQLLQQGSSRLGVLSNPASGAAQQHQPSIERSMSLPSVRVGHRYTSGQQSPLAAAPAAVRHSSCDGVLASITFAASCKQAEQQSAVSFQHNVQPAAQLSVQPPAGWFPPTALAVADVRTVEPTEAKLSHNNETEAAEAAAAQQSCCTVAAETSLPHQQAQHQPQLRWGAASFRNIVAAVSSVARRRTRGRTTSVAGQGNGHEQQKLDSAAAAAAAGDDDDNECRSEITAQHEMQSLDRIGSLKSFVAGGGSSVSFAAVQESGASFRSMRSARSRVSASFSSRQSFGAIRSLSAAWPGSFAARSTFSDLDDYGSMSQATLGESVGAGSALGPMVAAADMPGQPVVQQEVGQSPALGSSTHEAAGEQELQQEGPPASMSFQVAYRLATESAYQAPHLAAAADMPKPHVQWGDQLAEHKEHQAAYEQCPPSWLISTDAGPSFTASASAGSPGNAERMLNRSYTADLRVVIPEAATAGDSLPSLLLQQHIEPPAARAAAAGSAMHMLHSASAPHLHHDDSYVVRSPTPSQASLCTRFSHASIATHWWLSESCAGCGGSPTSAASLTGRSTSPVRPFGATKTDHHHHQQQGLGASGPSQPEFCFGVGHNTVAGCSSSNQGQQLSVNEMARQPPAAAAPAAVHSSKGGGMLQSMDKSPGTGGFLRGESPQVAVEVIEWGSLQIGRRLGQGSEGNVIEARYLDAPVAIKEGAASSEIQMFLAAGVHDNLVGLRGLTRKADGTWCLVLEHCGRGTLDMLIHSSRSPLPRAPQPLAAATAAAGDSHTSQQQQQQQLTRPDVVKLLPLMRGVVRGLVHMHSRKPAILHRDVKPANIMIGHGMQMKIGDLGMARHVLPPPPPAPSRQAHTGCSPQHRSPFTSGAATIAVSPAHLSPQHSNTHVAAGSPAVVESSTGSASGFQGVATAAGGLQQQGSTPGTPRGCAAAGGLLPQGSAPGTPKGPAVRTFTPGIVGTIMYTAPEVLGVLEESQQQPSVETVLKADVYSLGVTLWECVERQRPWQGLDGMQLWTMWVADPASVTLPPLTVDPAAGDGERDIMSALHALIKDCTQHIPEQRPSMRVVLDRVRHIQKMHEDMRLAAAGAAAAAGPM